MNQPLLSVIVPCCNVEKYIEKCISSIVEQTYPNLEILLVNDGSADQTGTLCDAWQEKDERIRVIHKQNEGVSYARKTGLESATAKYVTFVDADDWIDKNMYANMMAALLSTNSDIAQCNVFIVFEDGRKELYDNELKTDTFEVIERTEGVLLILDDKKWRSWMWNKIFKKNLFDHIVFPNEIYYEDVRILHVLFHHAAQSVYLNHAYYFYYQRMGSALNTDTIRKKLETDSQWANVSYDRYLFVKQHPQYHKKLSCVKNRALIAGVNSLRNMAKFPHFFPDDSFHSQSQLIRSIPLLRRDAVPFFFKLDLLVLKIFPCFYKPYRKLALFVKKLFKR